MERCLQMGLWGATGGDSADVVAMGCREMAAWAKAKAAVPLERVGFQSTEKHSQHFAISKVPLRRGGMGGISHAAFRGNPSACTAS